MTDLAALLDTAARAEDRGDHRDAVARYDLALASAPAAAQGEIHLRRLGAILAGSVGDADPGAGAAIAAVAGDLDSELAVQLDLARIAASRGRFADAIAAIIELRARAARLADPLAADQWRAEGHRVTGRARLSLGQLVAALAELDAAVALFAALADPVSHAAALDDRALVHGYAGDHARAIADDEAALALIDPRDAEHATRATRAVLAAIYNNLGFSAWNLGRSDPAREHLAAALALRLALGDVRGEGITRNNLGNVLRHGGDLAGARAAYAPALDLGRRAGDAVSEAIALNNLGHVVEEEGDLPGAERLYREALERARGVGDRIREGDNLGSLGACLLRRGEAREAAAWLREAVELRAQIADHAYRVVDLSYLAVAELALGRRAVARALADEALAAIDGGQQGIEQIQRVYLNAYRVARALDADDADDLLARAMGEVERGLASIADADARVAFVAQVGANREIAALWRARGEAAREAGARHAAVAAPVVAEVGGTFVGRGRELDALTGALAAATRSQGGLWLIDGDPGIGKTRLCEELARRARERDCATLWGRAWEAGGPAYAPWVELLQAYVDHAAGGGELIAALGAAGHGLGLLSRSLAPGDAVGDPASEPQRSTEFHISESVLAFLHAASAARPLVLFLDDLHACDIASLRLLAWVARELRHAPILIVATHHGAETRADDDRRRAIAALARHAQPLALGGLTEAETTQLASERVGGELPLALAAVVHQRSQGNPLFAVELAFQIAMRVERGLHLASTTDLPLARAVSEAILARLDLVSPAARGVLQVAAVIGRRFEVAQVARLCGWAEAGCLAAMEEGRHAGLVAPLAAAGELRFTEVLVRAALYRELAPDRRAALHRAFVVAAEQRFTSGPAPRHAELARHLEKAADPALRDQLARYHHLAGEQAAAQAAWTEAAHHLTAALRAMGEAPVAARCRVLTRLGLVQLLLGDDGAGTRTFVAAAELARGLANGAVLARVALGLGRLRHVPGAPHALLLSLCDEALARIAPGDLALGARLHARIAAELILTPRAGEREDHAHRAVELARASADPALLGWVLYSVHHALWTVDNLDARVASAAEMEAAAARAGQRTLDLRSSHARLVTSLELDDLASAGSELVRLARLARELGDPHYQWSAEVHAAAIAFAHGRLDDAEHHAGRALALGDRIAWADEAEVAWLVLLVQLRAAQGRLGELREAAEAALAWPPSWLVDPRCLAAQVRLAVGDEAGARALYAALVGDGVAAIPRDLRWLGTLVSVGALAIAFADRPVARAVYDALVPCEARNAVQGLGVVCHGPVALTLGTLAAALDREPAARAHLARALARAQHTNAPLVAGDAAARLAAVTTDGAAALALRRTARAAYATVGLAARVDELDRQIAAADADDPAQRTAIELSLARRENLWRVTWGDGTLWVRHTRGMAYLAALVERPGVDLHVTALAGAVGHASHAETGDAGEVLDARARAAYRARIGELEQQLAGLPGLAADGAALRGELAFLRDELGRAVGLGGRARRVADHDERLRQSITKRLRDAVNRLAEHDARLGSHLTASLRTGLHCAYLPGAR